MITEKETSSNCFYAPGSYLDRNAEIIRNHLYEKMHESLDIGTQLIDDELSQKYLSNLVKPVVKVFYSNLMQRDLEIGTKKSINGMIKLAKQLIQEGVKEDSEEFYQRLEEKFPGYLKNDQTGRQCNKYHKNFPRLKDNLKNTFSAQIKSILPLLRVEDENVTTYDDLCREAFKSKEQCKSVLKLQTDSMVMAQKIIGEDLHILNVPAGREMIFSVLQKGFSQKISDFNLDIDSIFS